MKQPAFFPAHSPAAKFFTSAIIGLLTATSLAAQESAKGWLLVANKGDHTLAIVDPTSGNVITNVPEDGITGHEVVASPDGKFAYVPIYGNSGVGGKGTDGSLIRVIDLAKQAIVGTVDLGKGLRPHCAVMGPVDGRLYVTTELEDSITIIDPETLKVIGTVPTGQPESHMLAITRDGKRGYTANVAPGTVSVLDLVNRKTITIIPVAPHVQRISLSPDDHWVFTADQTQPRMAVIDTTTNGVSAWIDLPSTGYGNTPSPDGHWLLVALNNSDQVGVIDLTTMKLAQTIPVPKSPQEILFQPDGAFAYVSCSDSRQVAVIDTKTWKVAHLFNTGPGTDGLAWAASK
jgi:YVTN family beta-propeller protein